MMLRAGVVAAVAGALLSCAPPPAAEPQPSPPPAAEPQPSPPPGALPPADTSTTTWQRVGTGRTEGISGLAPEPSGWLIARDNKAAGQNRISTLSAAGHVAPLAWPGTPPQDLESLAVVPGVSGQWATLTSEGAGAIFSISGSSVVIDRTFTVPTGANGVEGLALTRSGATTIAVWSTRGSSSRPARVYAATFDPSTGSFGDVTTAKVTVPYPTENARQISDLTLVGTTLVASSTSDPGANGPFDSALYNIGTVGFESNRAVLTMRTPQSLGTFPGHKIEGIACSGTTGLLGTDDENQGGWIRSASFCTP